MTILFLYSEKELISRNKYSSASIPSYDLMILAGEQETFKTRLTKTHLPFHQRLRHTFSIKLRNRDRNIPQNLSDLMLCPFVSTRGCQAGPCGIPGYPGIPVFFQNPDPGILKNLIPGFFGISRSP